MTNVVVFVVGIVLIDLAFQGQMGTFIACILTPSIVTVST